MPDSKSVSVMSDTLICKSLRHNNNYDIIYQARHYVQSCSTSTSSSTSSLLVLLHVLEK